MKDVKFITACPDDNYYTWQVHLWLESLKDLNKSKDAIVLLYKPLNRARNTRWQEIENLYPEAEFYYINERVGENMNTLIGIYIPIIRSYCMWRYLSDNPSQGTDNALFFCDSDILFTKDFNIDKFLDDDINYMSDSISYMGATYFKNKVTDVLPEKLEEFKKRDILAELLNLVGVEREVADINQEHSGGVQYILKNSTASYWQKVMTDSISIRTYMQKVNREFFANQDIGYQSWCADMWGILWNLWHSNLEVKVVPELDFSWASCKIDQLEKKTIFHNAGITGERMAHDGGTHLCFYKGKYHLGTDPTKDPMLDKIINSEESQKFCTSYYAKKVKELGEKYKIDY
jgi:hypothetical protein